MLVWGRVEEVIADSAFCGLLFSLEAWSSCLAEAEPAGLVDFDKGDLIYTVWRASGARSGTIDFGFVEK